MKITYTKQIVIVSFDEIKVGQCFMDNEGDVCLKVSNDIDCNNVFAFSTERLYEFHASNAVVPIEAELIVHAEER